LIGEAARQLPQELRALRAGGARPTLVAVEDDRGQAEYVVAEC